MSDNEYSVSDSDSDTESVLSNPTKKHIPSSLYKQSIQDATKGNLEDDLISDDDENSENEEEEDDDSDDDDNDINNSTAKIIKKNINTDEYDYDSDMDSNEDEDPPNKTKITDIPDPEKDEIESVTEDENESEDEDYFKKLDENVKKNIISEYHPELHQHNSEEIEAMTIVTRNEEGIIIDPLHKTIPILTKYEKARILGERARQLNAGAKPFIPTEPILIDGYLIALKELEQKKIPFIIKRPLPNGGIEYWKLKDLEFL